MSQLFNFSFQTPAGDPDSPGAINRNQVVYAYATQSTKTLLVFTNGDSRISDNTLASVKSTFGLTSIGSPTSVNNQKISLGQVLVNADYVSQVFDDVSSTRVQMNQPASSPVIFRTNSSIGFIEKNSFAAGMGYKEWIGTIDLSGTGTPTATAYLNTIDESLLATYENLQINGSAGVGCYKISFPNTMTSGNIATNWVAFCQTPAFSSFNQTSSKVNLGTTEIPDSIVLSFWSGSTAVVTTNVGKILVQIKLFG